MWGAVFQESYLSVLLIFVACRVVWMSGAPLGVSRFVVAVFFIALSPWLQFAFGTIHAFGNAWIHWLYLTGLCISIAIGAHWEKVISGQCSSFVFSAIFMASLVSVGLQLAQWFDLLKYSTWIAEPPVSRFYANIYQPNLLGSLLLLGCVAMAWAYYKKAVGTGVVVVSVLFLLTGVALTESRTAWINLILVLVLLGLFWRQERPRYMLFAFALFLGYFAIFSYEIPLINEYLGRPVGVYREASDPLRLQMWASLSREILERPVMGFGWGQLAEAIYQARDFPVAVFNAQHSHNIILDVLIFSGVVLGGLILLVCALFAVRFIRFLPSGSPAFVIPFAACSILIVHAMLELPLYYAYFLFPFGLLLGVMSQHALVVPQIYIGRSQATVLLVLMLFATSLTIRDYWEVERTHLSIYYGLKGVPVPPDEVPDIVVLTQWKNRFVFANTPPGEEFSSDDYKKAKGVVTTTPGRVLVFILAHKLALSGQAEEALFWLNKICLMTTPKFSRPMQDRWLELSAENAAYRQVVWPTCKRDEKRD